MVVRRKRAFTRQLRRASRARVPVSYKFKLRADFQVRSLSSLMLAHRVWLQIHTALICLLQILCLMSLSILSMDRDRVICVSLSLRESYTCDLYVKITRMWVWAE